MEDIFFYSSLTIFVCLLVTFRWFRQSERRRYPNLPPSPSLSLPILGHLYLLKPPNHRTFHRLSQKHGPVFSLWFGSRRVVIVESFSAVQECFTKNDIILANRPPTLFGKHLAYNHTSLPASPYGDHWRNIRRISTVEVLSTVRLNSFSDVRKDEIKHLLGKLSQSARGDNRFSKVELKSMLNGMTFNNIMRMVAGKRYVGDHVSDKEGSKEFIEIMEETFSYSGGTNPGEFMPFSNWFGGGGYLRKLKKLAKRSDVFLQGLIDEHRNKSPSESRHTMIGHLLSQQESQPEYYTDEIIKALILSLLLAGTDTSAVTLEWAMSNLINHPDYHLRDSSVIPGGTNASATFLSEDCIVSGFDIPRDTLVLVNAWAIHRDPKLWDDPESFKPERFEGGGKDEAAHKLIPFGLGRRACPGAGLAQREVGLTLASLIQCFEWKRISEKEIDMTEVQGITMPKLVPLEAMCKPRSFLNKVLH
ncbi:hypothetical protein M0R45_005487 [Rubus argutus]|uniref:Uncharacterized protein n=1 Tax=Rubus argutus TaxID=59490 RepID=A0AAW1YMK3_RUBAR